MLIYPKKWNEALKKDPSKPNDDHDYPTFMTAARRALMLYIPFRSLDDLANFYQFLNPPISLKTFDSDNLHWRICFYYRMLRTPTLFPQDVQRLFHGIEEGDFHLNINPFEHSDDEWDSTSPFP